MDTAWAIWSLVGYGVKYGGCTEFNTEEEFNKLRWDDLRAKPKWVELVAKWEEIKDNPKPKTKLELLEAKVNEMDLKIKELEEKAIIK